MQTCDACARPMDFYAITVLHERYRSPDVLTVCPRCADVAGRLAMRMARNGATPDAINAAARPLFQRIRGSWMARFRRWLTPAALSAPRP